MKTIKKIITVSETVKEMSNEDFLKKTELGIVLLSAHKKLCERQIEKEQKRMLKPPYLQF